MNINRCARILAVAGLAAASLLVGMRLRPQDGPAKTNATELYEAAKAVWSATTELNWPGIVESSSREVEARALWSRRLAEASVAAGALLPRAAFAEHVARMERVMEETKTLYEAGRRSVYDVWVVRFALAEAKGLLERAPGK